MDQKGKVGGTAGRGCRGVVEEAPGEEGMVGRINGGGRTNAML